MTGAYFHGPLASAFAAEASGDLERALPRLLVDAERALAVPPADDAAAWGTDGRADAATVDDLVRRARAELDAPWPLPLASAAARVHLDGDRVGWERPAFARQARLSRAVVAAAATDDDRLLAAALDGVVLLCEQSSWCWPAHDDAMRRHGSVLAVSESPFLDLGAGEVAGQLAHVDHLLGARLEARYPGIRARLRREVQARVLDPFVERRDWHWIGLDGDVHNWNPWIHGNVLAAALRLLDADGDAPLRARVVALAVEGLDRYVASLPEDGAIDEGYSYWWNGACRALEALELLRHATDGALDASAVPALRATVGFPHRSHLGGAWYLNVADGQARPSDPAPWHALHVAARRAGDDDAAAHAAAHREPGRPVASESAGLGRLLRAMTDEAWTRASAGRSPLPAGSWWPSVQVLLAREREGAAAGLTLAVKGGHNDEHHNHNDVGSFVVASDGVPVIVDVGRPTYTAQTFGPDRYDIWTMRSGWHNVPVIDGEEQPPGRTAAAADVRVRLDDDVASLALDLAPAYPASPATGWRRTATLDRTARAVTVEDTWTAEGANPAAEVRLVLAGEVDLHGDGADLRPLEGATPVRLDWSPSAVPEVVVRELDDPMLTDVWGGRLTRLSLPVPAGGIRLTVRALPVGDRS